MVNRSSSVMLDRVKGCRRRSEAVGVSLREAAASTDLGGSSELQMKTLKTVKEKGCTSTVLGGALAGPKESAYAVKRALIGLSEREAG